MAKKYWLGAVLSLICSVQGLCHEESTQASLQKDNRVGLNGWSLDLGGDYTWVSFNLPSNDHLSGNTGGFVGKVTHQELWQFFGQFRTVYNMGPLSTGHRSASYHEWYLEFVGGWCFPLCWNWTFTPYVGIGIDYLNNGVGATATDSKIHLKYQSYYAPIGFDTHYAWKDWMLGLQMDVFPIFTQYLNIVSVSGVTWPLSPGVGFDVRIPAAYRIPNYFGQRNELWLELAPYYRYMPTGSSGTLHYSKRNLNEWGFFLSFRLGLSKE